MLANQQQDKVRDYMLRNQPQDKVHDNMLANQQQDKVRDYMLRNQPQDKIYDYMQRNQLLDQIREEQSPHGSPGIPSSGPPEPAEPTELAVRESNLFYDFDHYQPQSHHKELANRADNLGFLTADENRRKRAEEFRVQPEYREQITLRDELDRDDAQTRNSIADMLGSRRFSEVKELNNLWQIASENETASYADSQRAFRALVAENQSDDARAVREALAYAGIDVVPQGSSYRFRMDDSAYRRSAEEMELGRRALQEWRRNRGS
jgi:hypothetical protein